MAWSYKDFDYEDYKKKEDFEYEDYVAPDKFEYDEFEKGEDFTYDKFTYDGYAESDAVKQAQQNLNAHLSSKPGEYQSKWQTQLDSLMDQIMNREKFTYDLNGDALYQQYKDKYIQQAKLAMADTMGQASAMTGGYGSSYAQSVGQQAYQGQLNNLNDIVPELYQMALDKYSREGQELYNQYGMVVDRENTDYGRYRDTVSDYLTERDYLTGRYDNERNYDYSKYVDDRNFAYGQYSDDRNLDYEKYINDLNFRYNQYSDDRNLAYSQYESDRAFGYDQYINDRNYEYGKWADERDFDYNQYVADRNLAYDEYSTDKNLSYEEYRAGIADEQWKKEYGLNERQVTLSEQQYKDSKAAAADSKKSYSGTTETGKTYNNGGLTDGQVKELQAALGVDADGKYGEQSKEAAGGLSAKEAWEAYQMGTLGNQQAKGTANTTDFINRYSDKQRYLQAGHTEKQWNAYMEDNIATFLRDDRITEQEALYLIQYYGLS